MMNRMNKRLAHWLGTACWLGVLGAGYSAGVAAADMATPPAAASVSAETGKSATAASANTAGISKAADGGKAEIAKARTTPAIEPEQLPVRYPANSIQSVEQADAALADVEQARNTIGQRHARQEAACYPKFFVSTCLEQAAEVKRSALVAVRAIEVEAARFKRLAKVMEHDKAMQEKREEDTQNAPQRLIKEQDFQKAQAEKEAAQAKAAADALAAKAREDEVKQKEELRQKQHAAKVRRIRSEQAAGAAKRAANVEAFEKKQQDAKTRQQELEVKRLEHEKKAAASAAAKAAGSASASGSSSADAKPGASAATK